MTEWDFIYKVMQYLVSMSDALMTVFIFSFAVVIIWQLIPIHVIDMHHKRPLQLLGRALNADTEQRLELHSKVLRGMGHDMIVSKGKAYIKMGSITPDEYENLNDYLYEPYKALGGNGTAERIMEEVRKLPIRDNK